MIFDEKSISKAGKVLTKNKDFLVGLFHNISIEKLAKRVWLGSCGKLEDFFRKNAGGLARKITAIKNFLQDFNLIEHEILATELLSHLRGEGVVKSDMQSLGKSECIGARNNYQLGRFRLERKLVEKYYQPLLIKGAQPEI